MEDWPGPSWPDTPPPQDSLPDYYARGYGYPPSIDGPGPGTAAVSGPTGTASRIHTTHDLGTYQSGRVSDPANTSYQPLRFRPDRYSIPVLTGFPRWFAVAGSWLGTEHPATAPAWLVFVQASPGARWLEIFKPYVTAAAP